MDIKYKITQILHENTTEVDDFNNAVFTDEFDKVAEEIVKLFAIPTDVPDDAVTELSNIKITTSYES